MLSVVDTAIAAGSLIVAIIALIIQIADRPRRTRSDFRPSDGITYAPRPSYSTTGGGFGWSTVRAWLLSGLLFIWTENAFIEAYSTDIPAAEGPGVLRIGAVACLLYVGLAGFSALRRANRGNSRVAVWYAMLGIVQAIGLICLLTSRSKIIF